MGKRSGGTKTMTPSDKQYSKAYGVYLDALNTGRYDRENSYFSGKGLGSVLYAKGHNYHEEEIECAKILADNGFEVYLQPEDGTGVSLKRSRKGGKTWPEGTIDINWFEQHTSEGGGNNTVFAGLKHAHEKGVEIAVIYDRGGQLHKNNIQGGIDMYNKTKFKTPKTIFKAIIVVSKKNKDWHEWGL